MVNEIFHKVAGPFSINEIAKLINAKIYNLKDKKLFINGAADVDNATSGEITFISFNNTLTKLNNSPAAACIVNKYNEIKTYNEINIQ